MIFDTVILDNDFAAGGDVVLARLCEVLDEH